MKILSDSILLLTLISSLTFTYASPTNSSLITLSQNIPILNISAFSSEPTCYRSYVPYSSRLARYTYCSHAVASLPHYHNPGQFHTGSPFDRFSLPHVQRYETCQVTVDINSYVPRDESSWTAVQVAAMGLINTCRTGFRSNAKTGGEIMLGTEGRIRVTVTKI